jgi:pantothenate kinase
VLFRSIARRRGEGRRLIVGIAGAPGAGKSTLAQRICDALAGACAVPMDGFHLSNGVLRSLGLAHVKGAPETFDEWGYVALLRRLRARDEEVVYAPSFDHVMNEPIAGSIPVPRECELVVTEGNYLLVWPKARELIDLTVHIDADPQLRVAGLIERQLAKGLDEGAAREWVYRSDEANARLVQAHAHLAGMRVHR